MTDTELVALAVRVLADVPEMGEQTAAALLAKAEDRLDQFAAEVAPMGLEIALDRVADGWRPRTLAHVVRHRDDSVAVGVLAGWIRANTATLPPSLVSDAWREQLDDLPPTVEPDLATVPGLAMALRVMAALLLLPAIRPVRCLDCEDEDEDGDGEAWWQC
jgi:hypothetical protein